MAMPAEDDAHARFVRLLSSHSRQVFGFILAMSPNRSDAEDIFQDVCVALWRKFAVFEEGTNFRAWACQVAYLEMLEFRRQKGRQHLLGDEAFKALSADALVLTADDPGRREEALAGCLKKLSKSDFKLIERRYFGAQSPKQIAEQSTRSVHSVYRALARIHDALLKCVQGVLAGESLR